MEQAGSPGTHDSRQDSKKHEGECQGQEKSAQLTWRMDEKKNY